VIGGLLLLLLIPFAGAGLALMNSGLCRARNAAHAMLASLSVAGVAALAYFAVGSAVFGYPGSREHIFHLAGRDWGWIASASLFLRAINFDSAEVAQYVIYGMFAAIVACIIPLSSGSGRWRLGASCASAAVFAGWTFPLFAHWARGGWLHTLGFVDDGGAASIHVAGGLTALAIVWILGPRRGKYTDEGMPTAIPGHNIVLVLSGCWLSWIGWLGLNCAGAALFSVASPGRIVLAALNTTLSAAAAALTAAAITRARFGKPDASLCANGWVAGLVSVSAGCALMPPAGAVLVGIIGGALAIYTVEWLELHLSVDDPGGAISVHAVGGIWSLLAVGLFGANWMAQLAGIATLLGGVLPISYGLNLLLNRFYPYRVRKDAERQGMDLHELGAGAYPDFASHKEDW
jgi:Amt family ammonium transporter